MIVSMRNNEPTVDNAKFKDGSPKYWFIIHHGTNYYLCYTSNAKFFNKTDKIRPAHFIAWLQLAINNGNMYGYKQYANKAAWEKVGRPVHTYKYSDFIISPSETVKEQPQMNKYLVWSPNGRQNPFVQHQTQEIAEKEAERLARKCPNETFYVVEIKSSIQAQATVQLNKQEY